MATLTFDHAEIIRLRAKGLLYKEIAFRLGCSENTVGRVLSKYDLALRNEVRVYLTDNDLARLKLAAARQKRTPSQVASRMIVEKLRPFR